MRVASDTRLLEVDPGDTTAVVVEVVNTGQVIDGVTAHVIGLSEQFVTAQPALLPLFPDTSGQVTLALAVPPSHPAGRHPLTVEVVSHGARQPSAYLDVDLDVSAKPDMRLVTQPRIIRARRGARFVLELSNEGNIPLDVTLEAVDQDRSTKPVFTPQRLRIDPGAQAPVILNVRGPRMFTGAELDRVVTVEASAQPVRALVLDEVEPEALIVRQATVQLRQRPLISRGLLTVLILLSIIALWAGVFLLGLGKVFGSDPMTKAVPASFFAANNSGSGAHGGSGHGSGSGSNGSGANGSGGAGGGGVPAGALPKSGEVPAGMGGEISGKVTAVNDGQPVGRILVQAWRQSRDGLVQVSSAATQSDGTYTLAGLFPTSYFIEFKASGYKSVWYPNSPGQPGSQSVAAVAQGVVSGVNATIVGLPASMSGTVNPGDALTPVTTTVTARPLLGTSAGKPIKVTSTDAGGKYTLEDLPAPGSYQLTFTTPGYQATTLTDSVGGGDARLEPTVILGASGGQISGVVHDGASPLGGAKVTTTVNGQALTVITPTTGQVGAFVLGNLSTPATYVITFSAPGHGSTTLIEDLKAGQSQAGLDVNLASGTGSVSGRLLGPNGKGLGGATVTVGGAAGVAGAAPGTTTLTAGSVGSFAINGLSAPGSYTLTFSRAGYASTSIPISLSANGIQPTVTARLATQFGSVEGTVRLSGTPVGGATVTATNGRQSWTGTSSTADGSYLIANLEPGSYSVTVTKAGSRQQTALVTVSAGKTTTQDLTLGSG